MSFNIAHFSDVHLPLTAVDPGELLNKRFIGFLSWHLRRHKIHSSTITQQLIKDIGNAGADHLAFTGDLVNIACKREIAQAAAWLEQTATADKMTMVPGNHDAYVAMPWQSGIGQWAAHMQSDLKLPGIEYGQSGAAAIFPILRQRRNIAIIGLSTAEPANWRKATGRLGQHQLDALETILPQLHQRGFFRLIMIHHPPLPGLTVARKALTDADELENLLTRYGAELILHGHNHTQMHHKLETATGTAHILGVPAASARAEHGRPAAWNLLGISRSGGIWQCRQQIRRYDPEQDCFLAVSNNELDFS